MSYGNELSLNPDVKRAVALNKVQEVNEEYNLGVEDELENVGVEYLGPYTNALTTGDGSSVFFDTNRFFSNSEEEQKRTTLHELLHVKQLNGTLSGWLEDEIGVSEEFSDEISNRYGSRQDIEGEVEVLLDHLLESDLPSSYPYAQSKKRKEWEMKGIDLESELVDDIEQLEYEVLGDRDVYASASTEDIYVETGNYLGMGYQAVVYGPEAGYIGEEVVEDYLNGVEDYLEPEIEVGYEAPQGEVYVEPWSLDSGKSEAV